MFYTGVGSRETPNDVMKVMYKFAQKMALHGAVLRSGGADGADTAFEWGCDKMQGKKEIYLPWQGFNGRSSQFIKPNEEAMHLASEIHPAWDRLSSGARKLHARNMHQVLGMNLETPSAFLVCWTAGGKPIGGTRSAIVLAHQVGIPVFNLFHHNLDAIDSWLKTPR